MKKINFISSLSVHKQYELRYWFWGTLILWLVSLVIGVAFVTPSLIEYISLKKEISILREKTTLYNETFQKKEALNTEYAALSQKNGQIKQYINQPKNPFEYIAAIFEASDGGAIIELLKCNKKNMEITILCPTAEHATIAVKRLSMVNLFSDIKLISLQHDTSSNQVRAAIKGTIIF